MNLLKTARRSVMGAALLRSLMVICSLHVGSEWKDASKIPVAEIIAEWRAQSDKGRYKEEVWSAAALVASAEDMVDAA